MRIARKLTLLAMLAIAATALAAPSAFAQVEPLAHNQAPRIAVTQEVHGATDNACPAVTPSPAPSPSPLSTQGGCRSHVSGPNVVWTAHLSAGGTEVVAFLCNVEFDLRVDGDGEGYISHQELTPATAGTCTRRACGQLNPPSSEGRAFSFFLRETEVAGQGPREEAVVLFCTEPIGGGNPAHCEVTVPFTQTALHRYQFVAADVSGHGTVFPHCEWTATFNQEAVLGNTGEDQQEQNIEIRHT